MSAILDQHNNYAVQHAQRRAKPDPSQRKIVNRESRGDLLKEDNRESGPSGVAGAARPETKDVEAARGETPRRNCLGRMRKRFKWLYKKLGLKHLTPFVIITIYSIVGAAIFIGLEKPNDLELKEAKVRSVVKARKELLLGIEEAYKDPAWEVPKRKTRLAQLLDYYEETIEFSVSNETIWTFWNSVYYCGTLYTTIGW